MLDPWLIPDPSRSASIVSVTMTTMMGWISAAVHPVTIAISTTAKSCVRPFKTPPNAHSATLRCRREGSLPIMEFPTIQFVAVLKARNIVWSCWVRVGLEIRMFQRIDRIDSFSPVECKKFLEKRDGTSTMITEPLRKGRRSRSRTYRLCARQLLPSRHGLLRR